MRLTSRDPASGISNVLPGARQQTKKAVRKQQNDDKSHCEDQEVGEVAERAQQFAHRDEKYRAKRSAENGAPATDHGGDDHLDTDRDVDKRTDGSRPEVENQKPASETRKKALMMNAASLCFVTLNPS